MIRMDYVENAWSRPRPLDLATFRTLWNGMDTKFNVEAYRAGNESAKRCVPGICWQAHFDGRGRTNSFAQPNGLFAIDIDGIDDPLALWLSFRTRCDELDILCVHQSMSRHGLHIVALCQPQFETIAENQEWLAKAINTPYDAVCHDLARYFAISLPDDLWYCDTETLFD